MYQYFVSMKENARTMKNVHTIVGVGLFVALNLVLNTFASIQITNELKLGFASVATAASCYLYGPIPNMIVAPILDFLNYCIKPAGAYFPLFIISSIVTAMIFAFYLYGQEKVSLKRCILCRLTYDIVVSLFLNSWFTSLLWSTPILTIITPKIIKNLITLPIQVGVLYFAMKITSQLKTRIK